MYYFLHLLTLLIHSVHSQLQDCGGILRATELELKSPGYPGILRPGVNCNWTVQAVSNKVCKLEVEFIIADLHDATLIIADVPHSGSIAGLRTYFFSNNTNISFRNGKGTSKGFYIIIKQKLCDDSPTPCDSVLNTKDITINGPPIHSQDCTFIVKRFANNACKITVTFDNFILASSKDCVMGGLEIGDDVICGSLDGHRKYDFINGELSIRFYSEHKSLRNKFSLKITQQICNNNPELSNKIEDFNVTQGNAKESFYNNYSPSYKPNNYGMCCNQIHSERIFYLASPSFPNSNFIDCTYAIQRNSPDIQYLRLNFKYFWIGDKDYYGSCNGGFLQIDGNSFCGCQTGVTWVTQFNLYDYSEYKILRLNINQAARNRFTGFVIEVIQYQYIDPPPNRYVRQLNTQILNQNTDNKDLQIIKRSSKLINSKDYNAETIYFPQESNESGKKRQARYQSHENIIVPTDFYCLSWNIKDWIVLLQQALWAQLNCPLNVPNRLSKISSPSLNSSKFSITNNCTKIKSDHGFIDISGVQDYEVDERCFSVVPVPGKCVLEVVFQGLEIPWSDKCNLNNVYISGIGTICPVSNPKTVQVSMRGEPVDIKIKNLQKHDKISIGFRQVSCT